MNVNLNDKYRATIDSINSQIPFAPELCIVLGSGLGDFANKVDTKISIATSTLPNYPKSTVQGHEGYLHFAELYDKKLLIVQGRIHFYEGYTLSQCILPVFTASKLGCKNILLTNAAGGVSHNFSPGDLMMATSFFSFNIKKEITELIGLTSLEQKNALLDFPSNELNNKIKQAALEENIYLREGVYWFSKGPSYETPAEIRMAGKLGADAVGMSTVHEAIFASSLGMKVASISCITNLAAGLSPNKLSHTEVMETAERVKLDFERLVKRTVQLI